jgi:hypothetical protein
MRPVDSFLDSMMPTYWLSSLFEGPPCVFFIGSPLRLGGGLQAVAIENKQFLTFGGLSQSMLLSYCLKNTVLLLDFKDKL